jgi:hypothetical protein
MRRVLLGLLLPLAVSLGHVQVVKVEPVKAAWSGRVHRLPPDNYFAQGITCNFDAPVYADFFTGIATDHEYQVEIRVPGRTPPFIVASGSRTETRDHVWVRCTLDVDYPDSIIKGRTYEIRWTLAGGTDSLVYYYDSTDAYEWGSIILPGLQAPIPEPHDLACRIYGALDPIDSTFWGMHPEFPWSYDISGGARPAWVGRAESAGVGMMRVDQRWYESESTAGDYAWGNLDSTCHVELFADCSCASGARA